MLSLTKFLPSEYKISDHKNEIESKILSEAKSKLFSLQRRLELIERRRIIGVNDTIEAQEISKKIVKANNLIKRMEFNH